MQHLPESQIGGGVVTRAFPMGSERLLAGTKLTGDQIRAMPYANRQALIAQGNLDLYPIWAADEMAAGRPGEMERYLVTVGPGKFIVVEGRSLTPEPIGSEEAKALRDGARA